MARSPDHNLVSPEAIRLGYEPQRISIRGLLLFFVLFAIGFAVLDGTVLWMMRAMVDRAGRTDVPRSLFQPDQQPPPPNLQPSIEHDVLDRQDLAAERAEEDGIFSKFGWAVDPTTHRVTIPETIVQAVVRKEEAAASAPFVPPTTTGKAFNSTVPNLIPPYDTQPGTTGGQRP